jgi:hypothetical protein
MELPMRSVGFGNSRGGTRTPDPVINSHLLYQLSYSGLIAAKKLAARHPLGNDETCPLRAGLPLNPVVHCGPQQSLAPPSLA